jgi:hypothetical protein
MDTEYVIQGAVMMAELTPFEGFCLEHIPDAYRQVRSLVDNDMPAPTHVLLNIAATTMAHAGDEVRFWTALRSLDQLPYCMSSIGETVGHNVQKQVQRDLGVVEENNLFEQLRGKHEERFTLVNTEADVTETKVRSFMDRRFGEFRERLANDMATLEAAAAWYRADKGHRYRLVDEALAFQRRIQGNPNATPLSLPEAQTMASRSAKVQDVRRKKARAAVKKVTKLFTSFGQEENLRLFVSGQEITLSHPDSKLKFVVRALQEKGWLLDRSIRGNDHTPYDLSVYTKDDVFVTRLCVYFQQSPVLDQVLALTMFVESGSEMDLLKKANWFSHNMQVEKTVLEWYPELDAKYALARDMQEPGGGRLRQIRLPEAFTRAQRHWQPYEGRVQAWVKTWFEPVTQRFEPFRAMLGAVVPAPAEPTETLVFDELELLV